MIRSPFEPVVGVAFGGLVEVLLVDDYTVARLNNVAAAFYVLFSRRPPVRATDQFVLQLVQGVRVAGRSLSPRRGVDSIPPARLRVPRARIVCIVRAGGRAARRLTKSRNIPENPKNPKNITSCVKNA